MMRKNLKAVALIIIGLALTGAAYTLVTDSSASAEKTTDTSKTDTTAKVAKNPGTAGKEEGQTKPSKASAKDSRVSDSTATDTITTASGLKYIITHKGEGAPVKSGEFVAVHYAGRLASNGKEFDNSFKRQRPIEFKLGTGRVIKGWDEGIAGMRVGEQRTLIIPPDLGYGKRGAGGGLIPPNATLVFDVQLVAIKPTK